MNTTDIPNGYVVRGPSGKNAFIEMDHNGKSEEKAIGIELTGWPDLMDRHGILKSDTLVLVHAVWGESGSLFKRLDSTHLIYNNEPVTVESIAKRGLLRDTAQKIWQDYMDKMDMKAVEEVLNEKVLT